MWPEYGGHMAWMSVWWLGGLALLFLVVWAIVRASAPWGSVEQDSPEAILKRRYARGEVDRDEYDRRLADLRK